MKSSKKSRFYVFAIFFIFALLTFNPLLNDFYIVKQAIAATNLSCSLNPFIVQPGEDVTISAVIDFTASDVWTEITNNGTNLQTEDLTSTDGIHYDVDITTSTSFNGTNRVAVYATDSGTGETYTCNPSDGTSWERTSLQDIPWHARYKHQVVSFLGKLWLLGGFGFSDVWSSSDGLNWTLIDSDPAWGSRYEHRAIVFQNKIWLMGGAAGGSLKNDVWSSSDGINWVEETASADWSVRTSFGLTIFNNKMWIVGGCDGVDSGFSCNHSAKDVWYSSDGIDWTLATDTPTFSSRVWPGLGTYNDGSGEKLWLVGGLNYPGPTYLNDVWYSSDGINWTQKTAAADFSVRSGFNFIVYNNGTGEKMYLMGGRNSGGTFFNDVWSSSDGENWDLVVDPEDNPPIGTQPSKWAGWRARQYAALVIHNDGSGNKLWILGGRYGRILTTNEIWKSADAENWELVGENYNAEFGRRVQTQLVTFNNKMWLMGGYTELPSGLPRDVWSSTDGVHWTCEIGSYTEETNGIACNHTIPAQFWQGRWGHSVFVYDNKIWLLGGCKDYTSLTSGYSNCSNANLLNDVWYTSDGVTWTQAANVNWPIRFGQSVTVYDGIIWLMGGLSQSAGYYHDVWYTTDPTGTNNWIQVPNAGWTARGYQGSIVFDNKLWVISGYDGERKTDAWYTTDPSIDLNWTEASSAIGWGLYGFGLLSYEDKLYTIAGSWDDVVRSSSDGINWEDKNIAPGWDNRDFGSATVYKNRMYFTAGESGNGVRNDVWASSIGLYFVVTENPTGQITISADVAPTLTVSLSSNSCSLGAFDTTKIKTCSYNTQVSTNSEAGYVAYIKADGLLRNGSNNISEVTGGTITAGAEAYGVSTTESESVDIGKINDANTDGQYTQADCTAMNNNTITANASVLNTGEKSFAKSSEPVANDTVHLCHEVAISGSTPAGTYSQLTTITVVSNF